MAEYYLIETKSITSKAARSAFAVDEIEKIARSILSVGRLLTPLLVRQTGMESYEVVAGDRHYYAAVRAQEIDPRKAEMVDAFVLTKGSETTALEQLAALYPAPVPAPIDPAPPLASGADQRLTNLETRLDSAIQELKQTQQQDVQRLEQALQALQTQIPARIEPLEALNTLKAADLLHKLAAASIKGKTAEKLIASIEQERKKEKFKSFTDVVKRIKGLSDRRMLSLIETWS